jgi:hypothetical protein
MTTPLSYARGDDVDPFDQATFSVARPYRDLTACGFEVWFVRMAMPSRGLTFHQEIQDAGAARERLVLVVGPKAAVWDYVRLQWHLALQADKARSPRSCGKAIILGPDEPKPLQSDDFRDDVIGSCPSVEGHCSHCFLLRASVLSLRY